MPVTLPIPRDLDECEAMLAEARQARDEARTELRRRDDIPNRLDFEAANMALDELLDHRTRLADQARRSLPRR